MDGELVRQDVLLGTGLADQLPGQGGGFTGGDHPTDNITAVDIENDVQVEIGPLHRPFQFRNVPGP